MSLFPDVLRLDWSETNKEIIEQNLKEIDLIIAADVIYDNSLFDSLLTTVNLLFNHCVKCDKLLLANAVRSPDTEQEFLTKLGNLHFTQDHLKLLNYFYCLHFNYAGTFGLCYQEEPVASAKLLYWEPNEFSPIKLYSICKIKE